jgi:hypothetical protein
MLPELVVPGAGKGSEVRSKNPEAPLPLVIDPVDLTLNRTPPQGPIRLDRLAANAEDQIGHLPVRVTLGTWIRDWADRRNVGEHGDLDGGIGSMCVWLANRTGWACDNHPAVDEYAAELQHLRGLLFALVGRPEPDERPTPLPGVPCPRCRHMSLARRHDLAVECSWPDCRSVWKPEEYERVTKAVAGAIRRGQITREDKPA